MNIIQKLRINHLNKKAFACYEQQEYLKAIPYFEKMRHIFPHWSTPVYNISLCHFHLNDYKTALEFIEIALDLEPDELGYVFQKIIIFQNYGKNQKALLLLKRLLEVDPINPQYLDYGGYLYFDSKDYDKALATYQKLLSVSSNQSHAKLCISDCYSQLNQRDKAILYLEEVLIEDPRNVNALNNLGYNRLFFEEYEKAIIDFDRVIALQADYAFAYNNRGFAKMHLGLLDEAKKDILNSIELNDQNSYAYKNLGLYYLKINEKEKALAQWTKAQSLGFKERYGDEVDQLIASLNS